MSVVSDHLHVGHHGRGFLEDVPINSLKNVLLLGESGSQDDKVSVIHISGTDRAQSNEPAGNVELSGNGLRNHSLVRAANCKQAQEARIRPENAHDVNRALSGT